MDYNSYSGGGGGHQSYTTYGAAGDAHQGGGFVGGEPPSSQAQGRGYGQDTVRPVTVAQIVSASQLHPEAEFKIDGASISHLTFVGQVRSVQPQTTNITYKVDDGTGIMEVKQWISPDGGDYDDDDNAGGMDVDSGDTKSTTAGRKKKEIKEDDYVRVWGRVKDFNGKRHVGSHIIRRIDDYDEINYHLLEATSVHLYFTRGPPPQQQQEQQAGQQQQQQEQQDHSAGGPSILSSMSSQAKKVYHCLRGANNNEGLNVHVIASNTGMDIGDVYRVVEELVHGGVIFPTLDDETYAILEA